MPPEPAPAPFRVGDRHFASLQAAFDALQDGDALLVAPGNYFDQAGFLRRANCTVRGDGGLATFKIATAGGKACMVISGANARLERIGFEAMRVPDGNGAGIRLEASDLTLRGCRFRRCENGILTNNGLPESDVVLEDCEVIECGLGGGQAHGIYIGSMRSLTVRRSRFGPGGGAGHLLKTRTARTTIEDSVFDEGPASRALDLCHGGVVEIRGSTFIQTSETDNDEIIGYGTEGKKYPENRFHFGAGNRVSNARQPPGVVINFRFEPDGKEVEKWQTFTAALAKPAPGPAPVVLTPQHDAAGKVRESFWSALPASTWVELAGTRMDSLVPKLAAGFVDHGTIKFAGVTAAWSGAAFDAEHGRLWASGGGHNDSSNNGFYEFDLERLAWRIAGRPSLMSLEQYREAWAKADAAAGKRTEYTFEVGCDGRSDATCDGKRPARHTYNDLVWSPNLQKIVTPGGRSYWLFDPAKDEWQQQGESWGWSPGICAGHDPVTGYVYRAGAFRNDYWTCLVFDPAEGKEIARKRLTLSPSSRYFFGSLSACLIERRWFMYNAQSYAAWTIDLETFRAEVLRMPEPPIDDRPLNCAEYVQHLGVVMYWSARGRLMQIDPKTSVVSEYATKGAPPPVKPTGNGVYGRFRYYPERRLLVVVVSTAENVRVMRL